MSTTVLSIILVPIALIFVASAYNFMYLFALLGVLPHIRPGEAFNYVFRLATLQADAAGQLVQAPGSQAHAIVVMRFRRGLAMTMIAFATMAFAIVLIWIGEAQGWWQINAQKG
jgi:hypothetical protein